MQREERLNLLRKQVGYLTGRRKVLAMAELAGLLATTDYLEAISIASDAVERARSLIDNLPHDSAKTRDYQKALAYALAACAECQEHRLEASYSPELFEEAMDLLEKAEDWDKLFDVFDKLALNHRQHSRLEASKTIVGRALALAEMQNLPAQRCKLHAARATVLFRLGDPEAAERELETSLGLLTSCSTNREKVEAYCCLAEYYYSSRAYETAIEYYKMVAPPATAEDDRITLTAIYWQLNWCYVFSGQREKTYEVLLEGFQHAKEGHFLWMEAVFAQELGDRMIYKGNFSGALNYLHRCEDLFEQLGNYPNHTNVIVIIGRLHLNYGDTENGHRLFRRAFKLIRQHPPHPLVITNIYNILGEDIWDQSDYNWVVTFAGEAKKVFAKYRGTDVPIGLSICLGVALMKLGKLREAHAEFSKALSLAKQHDGNFLTYRALLQLAKLHLLENDADRALHCAQEAESNILARGEKEHRVIVPCFQTMVQIHECRGDYKKACEYLHKINELEKEVINRRNSDIVNESRPEIEFLQLRLLHNDLKAKAESLEEKVLELTKANRDNAVQLEYLSNHIRELRDELRQDSPAETPECEKLRKRVLHNLNNALTSDFNNKASVDLSGQADFIQRLAAAFPALSQTDRKVCSLIKTGLGSKEVGRILNVSPRTVDTYRYRIRRKLQLSPETELNLFLEKF